MSLHNMKENTAWSFRPARPAEGEAVLALWRAAAGRPFCTWDETYPGRLELEGDLASGGLFVLEVGGQPVGAVSAAPENELDDESVWHIREAREIARVVVDPARQGQGYAALLVQGVLEHLRRQGCRAVHLAVAETNLPARKLYDRLGFAVVGECDRWGIRFLLCEKRL